MKKVFTMFSLLLACLFVHAESKFYFDAQKIKPGETKQIELSLLNESICEGFQLKVTLPENVSFVEDEDEEDYFMKVSDRVKKKFNVECSLRDDGSLNLVGYLSGSTTIDAGDGPILVLFVKADDNATIGTTKIKISNAEINLEGSVNVKPADEEFDFSIYDVYTVTTAVNNNTMGSVEGGGEVESGNSTTVTATAAEGYHFVNWTTGETAVSTDNPYSFTAEESVTLTANFAPNQYAMTFVLDNGQDNVVLTQDYATELSAPADPTKTGFTFDGWSPAVPATVPASAQTFTAQWTRNNYNLTFVVDGESTTTSVAYEAPITKPADPVKEGYTFTGWDAEIAETMPAQDLTYTAQFTINQYAMTFVLDNGQDNVVLTQDYATELSAPADPTKTGFTFAGWSPAVPATVPASAQTFTAQWTRNNYNLTFVVDGESNTTSVAYEAPITKPADPVKEGYTFTGWDAEIAETMPAEDLTYTAQFTINTYAVIYMVDGEEWSRDSVVYGGTIEVKSYEVPEGMLFSGWSTDEEYTTMPAHDVVYSATLTINRIARLLNTTGNVNVYSLNGLLVARNVPVDKLQSILKTGTYIVNGKKINIRK